MERHVIVYDIHDDDRRIQVHKILKNYGMAVQESVFEVNLREEDMVRLQNELLQVIRKKDDSLIFYRLCERCTGTVQRHGRAEDPFANPVLII